jgi:predicted transposase YbfD/YdcC
MAIPKLLRTLELNWAIITMAARGSLNEIAVHIVDGGGDYVFAIADNHP